MLLETTVLFTRNTLPVLGGYAHVLAFVALIIVFFIFFFFHRNKKARLCLFIYIVTMEILYFISSGLHALYWPDNTLRMLIYTVDVKITYIVIGVSFITPSIFLIRHFKQFIGILWMCLIIGELFVPIGLPSDILLSSVTGIGLVAFLLLVQKPLPGYIIWIIVLGVIGSYFIGTVINIFDLASIPGLIDSNEVFHYFTLVAQGYYLRFLWWIFATHTPSST